MPAKTLHLSDLLTLGILEERKGKDGKRQLFIAKGNEKRARAYLDGASLLDESGEAMDVDIVHMHCARKTTREGDLNGEETPSGVDTDPENVMEGDDPETPEGDDDLPPDEDPEEESRRLNAIAKRAADEAAKQIAAQFRKPKTAQIHLRGQDTRDAQPTPRYTMPAEARRYPSQMRLYKDNPATGHRSDEIAYAMGMSVIAAIPENHRNGPGPAWVRKAQKWCREHGVMNIREYSEQVNRGGIGPSMQRDATAASFTDGGYARRPDFIGPLFEVVQTSGVYPKVARYVPMSSDTADASFPKIKDLVEGRGETEDLASLTTNIEQVPVTLNAKDIRGAYGISRDLSEDMIVPVFDMTAHEVAVDAARKIDLFGFAGAGTVTHNGFVGLRKALRDVASSVDDIESLVQIDGHSWSEITRQDLLNLMGRAQSNPYAAREGCTWCCSPRFYAEVMVRCSSFPIATTGGGQSGNVMVQEPNWNAPMFMGYPVILVHNGAMPMSTPAAGSNSIPVTFGNHKYACIYGDRKVGSELIVDESIFVLRNQIALVFKLRCAVANVNLMNTTYSDGTELPGAVCGLYVVGNAA